MSIGLQPGMSSYYQDPDQESNGGSYAMPTIQQQPVNEETGWSGNETTTDVRDTRIPMMSEREWVKVAGGTDMPANQSGKSWITSVLNSEAGKEALGAVSGFADAQIQSEPINANAAYNNQLQASNQLGKTLLNTTGDEAPSVDEYMASLPSAADEMQKSTLTGGSWSGNVGGRVVMNVGNPIGGIVQAVGGKKYKGVAEYSSNQALTGALSGASGGGWQSIVVGAIVGAIKGVFSWKDAKNKDEAMRSQALAEFTAQLKEWEQKKNLERREKILGRIKDKREKKQNASLQRVDSVNTKRDRIMELLDRASSLEQGPQNNRGYEAPTIQMGR